MIEIDMCGTPLKRPWIAELTGVEATKDGKMRFVRNFNCDKMISKCAGTTNDFVGRIYSDGIYEAWEAKCRYFLLVCGSRKVIIWNVDIFPKNWGEYMREHNCSYEDVWAHAWDELGDLYGHMQRKRESLAAGKTVNAVISQ